MKDLARMARTRTVEKLIERRAIVVASDLQYGLARMFAQLVEPAGQEVRPFRDIDEARRWVEEE